MLNLLSNLFKNLLKKEDFNSIKCVACGKTITGYPWKNVYYENLCKKCFCSNEVNINHKK